MQPLAERLRPKTLDDYIGQKHLVGPGAILRKMIDAGRISSFILWGPPGVGKTTLAQIIANKLETPFYTLSAVTSGVKDAEGKVVYSSTEWNVDKINIDLTSEQKGKYTLEIQLPTEVFSGEFELEN